MAKSLVGGILVTNPNVNRRSEDGSSLIVSSPIIIQLTPAVGTAIPGGFWFNNPSSAQWLRVIPGCASFNGTNVNGSLGWRLYKAYAAMSAQNQYIATPTQAINKGIPDAIGNLWETIDVPWQADLRLFMEFCLPGTATIPVNSFIELSITPYSER